MHPVFADSAFRAWAMAMRLAQMTIQRLDDRQNIDVVRLIAISFFAPSSRHRNATIQQEIIVATATAPQAHWMRNPGMRGAIQPTGNPSTAPTRRPKR